MDKLLLVVNVTACVALAAVSGWAVLSERVRDGVLIKVGLIVACIGFLSVASILSSDDPNAPLSRALVLLHIGLLIVVAGAAWRALSKNHDLRRLSDWIDAEDAGRGRT